MVLFMTKEFVYGTETYGFVVKRNVDKYTSIYMSKNMYLLAECQKKPKQNELGYLRFKKFTVEPMNLKPMVRVRVPALFV